jgi:putative effector of murein hydrolase
MVIAGILAADESMVVVMGLLGAIFGASILTAFDIKDAVVHGLGIGAVARSL